VAVFNSVALKKHARLQYSPLTCLHRMDDGRLNVASATL